MNSALSYAAVSSLIFDVDAARAVSVILLTGSFLPHASPLAFIYVSRTVPAIICARYVEK
jgi:hypothetical protein